MPAVNGPSAEEIKRAENDPLARRLITHARTMIDRGGDPNTVTAYESAALVVAGVWDLTQRDRYLTDINAATSLDRHQPFELRDHLLGTVVAKQIALQPREQAIVSVNSDTGQILGAESVEGGNARSRLRELARSFPQQTLLIAQRYDDQLRIERGDLLHKNASLLALDLVTYDGRVTIRPLHPVASYADIAIVATPSYARTRSNAELAIRSGDQLGRRSRDELRHLHYSSQVGVDSLVQNGLRAQANADKAGKRRQPKRELELLQEAESWLLAAEVVAMTITSVQRSSILNLSGIAEKRNVRDDLTKAIIENQLDPRLKVTIIVVDNKDAQLLGTFRSDAQYAHEQCASVRRAWIHEGNSADVSIFRADFVQGRYLNLTGEKSAFRKLSDGLACHEGMTQSSSRIDRDIDPMGEPAFI